ncbi:heparinase II/III domain-containing protein [Paenibacillus sp. S28]|uniref:heparinase II/III domain-containing protein n=1 Tax=Paenibacillus sp. S28 TaxID=2767463 RepID=UPI001909494A|nr:heparinase II/III family protein [Paenibacillus sp. S28]MBJ9990613.1 heparinase II/III family protein [Paenibacillus sp. S28]
MLAERFINDNLGKCLLNRNNYRPFPTIEDRSQWKQLPLNLRSFWINEATSKLHYAWPTITATQYMDYSRTGNRVDFDNASWKRREVLSSLVIAECFENQGRFMDDVINGIWCICEETFWGIPGHGYMMKRQDPLPDISDQIIELFSAETAALLAWTYYLLKTKLDGISIMVSERIQHEVKRRILDPYLQRNDFWWMGFNQEKMLNNWNSWCNSNCLAAFLLLEDDPNRREAAVVKAMRSLDMYLHRLPSDGGCEEGPKYWMYAGGTIFDSLELLYGVSGGKIDVYQEPQIRQIGCYIYKAFIDDSYYVNFADSQAQVHIPAELTYRYGRRIGDSRLCELGARVQRMKREEGTRLEFSSMFRLLPALFNYTEVEQYSGKSPYIRDAWFDSIQIMVAREQEGSSKGLFLAAKGGHNGESHNHNDIGQFIVYCNGSPMIIDPGLLTYTSKSFFSERYTLWAMQSGYHNLPIVNGVQQQDGRQFRADEVEYNLNDNVTSLSMNLAGAYPGFAGIKSWIRSVNFYRDLSPNIEISDNFLLNQVTDDITQILITPHPPQTQEIGNIILQDKNYNRVKIQYDSEMYAYSVEKILLEDEIMREIWGDALYRIKLTAIKPAAQGECVIRISR